MRITSIQHLLQGLLLLILFVPLAVSEELTLQNGQKIVGTIVGYEDGMFRVETEYGFALIRKDKVASISFAAGSSKGPASKGSQTPKRLDTGEGASAASGKPHAASTETSKATGETSRAAVASPPAPVKASPPVSRPLNEPLPAQIRERLEGFNYVNETFQFAMYKPPGWKLYEDVPRETGRAIVAIGTEDEQTLLIVDRQVWSGPPDLKSDTTEANLRQAYQDYQKESESSMQLDGHSAVRRAFSGVVDGVEWHGIAVHLVRGNTVFGIIGLTSAETYQFQQAVLNKIINSFHFLTRPAEAGTAP